MSPDQLPSPSAGSASAAIPAAFPLERLRPDRLRIGAPGVFAGSWACDETSRIPVGFLGTLEGWWNGWAVWSTTREVVEVLVADQQRLRELEQTRLTAEGVTGTDLMLRLDEALPPMYFDGPDLVVNEYASYGEQDPLVRCRPDENGRYMPMAWHWSWIPVDPAQCDRVAGLHDTDPLTAGDPRHHEPHLRRP